jgi:hypothetical protein
MAGELEQMYHLHYSILCILVLFVIIFLAGDYAYAQTSVNNSSSNGTQISDYLDVVSNTEKNQQILHLPIDQLIFTVTPHYDENGKQISLSLGLKPGLDNMYEDIGLFGKPRDIVFIYPSFTQAAYGKDGFYDFYKNTCDTKCLTVPIPTGVHGVQASSIAGAWALKLLNYPYLKDEDVDKNPDILKQYKRVIVLHNEYVTKKEFDAITNHPNVIFLYPNALYAEVKTDYNANTITLVNGHGFPNSGIRNGFSWKDDNSKYEYDVECNNWYFYNAENYVMLNCYPEYKLLYAEELLRLLQNQDPADLLNDMNDWIRYKNDPSTIHALLDDFNISGNRIPSWVANVAILTINGDVAKNEFTHLLQYLHNQNLLN